MNNTNSTPRYANLPIAWGLALALLSTSLGCTSFAHHSHPSDPLLDVPRELEMTTHPEYRVAAPDILLIEAVNNIRPPGSTLQAGDQILVQIARGLPLEPDVEQETSPLEYQAAVEFEQAFKTINAIYLVGANGTVDLGPYYGAYEVAGRTVDEAQQLVQQALKDRFGLREPQVTLILPDVAGKQAINGEHLVRPDGTVSLGVYGSVYVAGMTLEEIKSLIEAHLSRYIHQPELYVDVLSYNSKTFYVVMDGGGYGERVVRLPCTGNETVLDAIAQVQGLSEVSSRDIWVVRPAPAGTQCAQVLDVHWSEIVAEGITTTNYQILPGDRIYVEADRMISVDNALAKLISPVERVLGVVLLGTRTVQQIDNPNSNNGFGF